MMIDIAERGFDDSETLEQMGSRDLVGHAHAAMQLHCLLSDEARRLPHPHFCRRYRAATLVDIVAAVTHGRQIRRRARLLGVDQHLDHPVLQRLEAADRQTELLAHAQVVERVLLRDVHRAERFRRQREQPVAEYAFEQLGARPAAEVAGELRELLRVAEIPGPYVLVAHSAGAVYARRFAQLFPGATGAMLLIDPGHEDLFSYLPPEAVALNEKMRPDPGDLPDLTGDQLSAARDAYARLLAAWPPDVRDELIDHHLAHWRTALHETANLETEIYEELRRGGPVPDVPVVVLTAAAGNPAWARHAPAELVEEALTGIRTLHAAIAASFTDGTHHLVEGATHQFLHIEHPEAVRSAVRSLVDKVSRRPA